MQLVLENQQLPTFLSVLEHITVRNMKANRGRAKLLRHVSQKLEEYIKDETAILSEYVVIDDTGRLVRNEVGDFKLKDPNQFMELSEFLNELRGETATLSFGEYQEQYEAFFAYLSDADDDFTAEQMLVIDDILNQFEKGETT